MFGLPILIIPLSRCSSYFLGIAYIFFVQSGVGLQGDRFMADFQQNLMTQILNDLGQSNLQSTTLVHGAYLFLHERLSEIEPLFTEDGTDEP